MGASTNASGLGGKLDQIRTLFGPVKRSRKCSTRIVRRTVLNHLIRLMSKPVVTAEEAEEIQLIKRRRNEYVWMAAMEKRKAAA